MAHEQVIDGPGIHDAKAAAARIGPNAVIQIIPALELAGFAEARAAIFNAAGLGSWSDIPPYEMVDETAVAALHRAVRRHMTEQNADLVMRLAGKLTADYLLKNRIPTPVQTILRVMPRLFAAPILARAIARHAWTFAGSGAFSTRGVRTIIFRLKDNPLCEAESAQLPICQWHCAVFQRLFAAIIDPDCHVVERHCTAQGAGTCVFEVKFAARIP